MVSNPSPHLQRRLGLWSAVAVVVGSTIGSGIFRSPSAIAEQVPAPIPMLFVWVVAGLFALCGALTLAEVGGAFPYSGGIYVFLREAYGRLTAFLFGWAQLVLIRPAAQGAVALVFAEYALRLKGYTGDHPDFARYTTYLAIAAMIVVAAANYRGVVWGATVQNLTTLAKTGGLLALVALAYVMALPDAGSHFLPQAAPSSLTFSAFGLALVSALWAYDGWGDVVYVGGEVANPRRNVPRAIVLGTSIIIVVYLLANVAYLSVLPSSQIAESPQIAVDVMTELIGPSGVVFIVATVMLSTFGTLNGSLLTAPRIFYALAEDGLFFKPIAAVHPRFHTPHISIILTLMIGLVYVSIGRFEELTGAFVIAGLPFYGLAVGSVFLFRRRARQAPATEGPADSSGPEPELPSGAPESAAEAALPDRLPYYAPVRTPLYPFVPLVFILSTVMLLANALMDESSRMPTLLTLGLVVVGAPIYFLTVGRRTTGCR